MIEQISNPGKTVLGTSVSRYVSNQAPIIFEYQRKDWLTTNYGDYLGNVTVRIATTDTSLFTVGDTVFFYATDGATTVSGVATVDNITVTSYTEIVLSLPYQALTPTEQYINLNTVYSDYAANIEVYGVRDDSEAKTTQSISPDKTGLVRFDARPFVAIDQPTEDYVANQVQNDLLISFPFYLKVGEYYDYTTIAATRLDPEDYTATQYIPTIASKYGQNLGLELSFPGGSGDEIGQFLTDFEKPTFFKGWPFTLTFLYVPNGVIDNLSAVIKEYDRNGTLLATTSSGFTVEDLTEPIKLQIIQNLTANTCLLRVSIEGTTTFSFLTIINPGGGAGTFDPSISTSSGIADWLFEDSSTLSGNGISTSGNGLDGSSQVVRISNLDPSVITSVDFSDDKISGKFDASTLVNCTLLRLQDNVITSFTGAVTSASMTEIDLSNNPGLLTADLSGYTNLGGILNLSDCSIGPGGLSLPSSNQAFTSFDLSGNSLGYINLGVLTNLGGVNGSTVNLADMGLTQNQVNSYIIDLNRIMPTGYTGRVIQIDGTNSAPNLTNPAVIAALASLSGKNVTVNYSGAGGS